MTKQIVSLFLFIASSTLAQNVIKNPDKITPEILQEINLLELGPKTRIFDPSEIYTIKAFVKKGGSLLAIIDEERRSQLLPDGINSILSEFGIEFTKDTEYLHNCGALAVSGVINAADREVAYSGGREVNGGTPFAWRLSAKGELAEPYAAYWEAERGGRVIALAEGMANLGLGTLQGERLSGVPRNPKKTTYWGKDSTVFMQEIRNWLTEKK